MAGTYTATWISDEKAGGGGKPNSIRFRCDTNGHAEQVAGNLDNLISGDLMSVTNDMDVQLDQSTYPDGTDNVESGLVIALGGAPAIAVVASEHFKFFDVKDGSSARTALQGYVNANAGKLMLFESGLVVAKLIAARS